VRAGLAVAQVALLFALELYDLRHFAATQMMASGVDPVTGAARLGHKRRDTFLNRYSHAVPARDREAAERRGGSWTSQQ
jgi:integrase